MADEELHETDSNDQKDWQSETSSEAATDDAAKSENAADETAAEVRTTALTWRRLKLS